MNISIAVDVVLEVRRGEVVDLRGRVLDGQHPRHARHDLRALRRALRRQFDAGQDALAERRELRRDQHVRAQLVDRVLDRDTRLEVRRAAAEHRGALQIGTTGTSPSGFGRPRRRGAASS
jgi:hypothetical protein